MIGALAVAGVFLLLSEVLTYRMDECFLIDVLEAFSDSLSDSNETNKSFVFISERKELFTMRYLIIGLMILFAACEAPDEVSPEVTVEQPDAESYLEKWQLVEMSGDLAEVKPATGSDMAWQEYYLLYEDDTFKKVRERDGNVKEASGTYEFVTLSDGEYLELTYPSENELIGNCTGEPEELLRVESESKLIGTWWACDGPGLVYEKVEQNQGGAAQ